MSEIFLQLEHQASHVHYPWAPKAKEKKKNDARNSPSMGDGQTPGPVQRNAPVDEGVQEGRDRDIDSTVKRDFPNMRLRGEDYKNLHCQGLDSQV